nr:hypothetical protein [Tanacetum cinerariifolium]
MGLAQMGYEKPSTKLTFYTAFFSSQWKFLIHTILQSLSAKRTSWNEFSTAMASAVICLSKGQRFNFSRYIFDSLVRNVDSSSKFYMYPRFIQLIIQAQVVDFSSHTTRYISPALTQKVFANMRRVGKGCSGVETPLFENMLQVREEDTEEEVHVSAYDHVDQENVIEEIDDDVASPTSPLPSSLIVPPSPPHQSPRTSPSQAAEGTSILIQQVLDKYSTLVHRVEGLEYDNTAQKLEILKLKARVKKLERLNKVKSSKLGRLKKVGTSQRIESSEDEENVFNQGRISVDIDEGIKLVDDQEKDAQEDSKVQEVVEVMNAAKLITEVVTAATTQVIPAAEPVVAAVSTPVSAAKPKVLKVVPADIQSKESTLQVVYDVLRRSPFFKAFLVTADVPEIYMQEFWATAYVHQHSIIFKMDTRKNIVDLEAFREMLHISPRIPGQSFVELPFKEEILEFLRFLRHSAQIKTLTDASTVSGYLKRKFYGGYITEETNTNAYKEYYACAIGEAAPKPKASARRKRGGSDSSTTPQTAVVSPRPIITVAAPRLTAAAKGKQPARATSPTDPSDVERTETEQLKIVLRRSRQETYISQQGGSSTDKGTGSKPGVPDIDEQEATKSGEGDDEETESDGESKEEETREEEEESFDPIPRTPEDDEDDGNGDEDQGLRISEKERIQEEEEADELYRDVDIN